MSARGGAWNMGTGYTRVCFTVNMTDEEDWPTRETINELRVDLNSTYFICAKEIGTEAQRKHLQGYMEFAKKKLGSAINNAFRRKFKTNSVHFESARGSAQANIDYCSKQKEEVGEEPYSFGETTGNDGQGTRKDIKQMMHDVEQGRDDIEIAREYPAQWLQYRKGIEDFKNLLSKPRNWATQLIFLWGPTGTGKSCHARELNPDVVSYVKGSGFINNYTGRNEVVLFDDFDWKEMPPKFWLQLTDRHSCTVNTKGTWKNWNPRTIIFTSNDDPYTWWTGEDYKLPQATLEAIHRRITEFGRDTGGYRHMGELIPHTENILTNFFRRKEPTAAATEPMRQEILPPSLPSTPPEASGEHANAEGSSEEDEDTEQQEQESAAQPIPSPKIIDLTGDSDEEVRTPRGKRVLKFSSRENSDEESETEKRERQLRKRKF